MNECLQNKRENGKEKIYRDIVLRLVLTFPIALFNGCFHRNIIMVFHYFDKIDYIILIIKNYHVIIPSVDANTKFITKTRSLQILIK